MASDIEKRMPMKIGYTRSEKLSSLHVFRNQEIDNYNKLISVMKLSLRNLKRAIEG